jgi:hypothetical protein
MPGDITVGSNYDIEENSNGNLIIKDSTGSPVLIHEDGGNFQLGAGLELGDLIDGGTGDTVYDGSTETLGNGTQDADLNSINTGQIYSRLSSQSTIIPKKTTLSSGEKRQLYPSIDPSNTVGTIMARYSNAPAIFLPVGGGDSVDLLSDPTGNYSVTEGNSGTVNIYYDSSNGRYEIENAKGFGLGVNKWLIR